jgi:hypothetical protein
VEIGSQELGHKVAVAISMLRVTTSVNGKKKYISSRGDIKISLRLMI